ncbi:MAG: transglutaminase family protein [Thermoguttaceae bacterium]
MASDAAGGHPTPSDRAGEPLDIAAALHRGGAGEVARGGLSDIERSLFADAADGKLEQHSLLVATLVASGVESPEVLDHYQRQIEEYAAELKQSGALTGSGREDTEAVFNFLHRRILLGGYRIDCTDLRTALDEGRYNCVSASVLFQCLAERCGLTVRGLEMPGHAMSRVYLAEEVLDVETTCAAWFRLMDDPKRQAQSVRETLGTTPAGRDVSAREISSVGLVAMVYYNRGVDLLAKGRYAEAALANAKALVLDPGNQTARGNLLATVNNWAIALGQSGRLAEAVGLLEAGLTFAPHYEPFTLNLAHVQYQRQKQHAEDAPHGEQPVGAGRRAAAAHADP